MINKEGLNIAVSNRAKLLNLARKRGEDFQFLLSRWTVERFLYRLSISTEREKFVLKGAMLFLVWDGCLYRPTKDLDLLGYGNPDISDVARRIRAVCAVSVRDGLLFDVDAIRAERIKEGAEYEGVRLIVPASLDGARSPLQIDVGFGDAVVPPATEVEFPVLLPLDIPRIRAYVPALVVAEKFQAMVALGIANSRMKDFFDIWMLAKTHAFDTDQLAQSIRHTFERRRTSLPEGMPFPLTAEFLEDGSKKIQWTAFGKRTRLVDLPPLRVVGDEIAAFLMPILEKLS